MRQFIAVIAGWVLFIPLFLILSILISFINGSITRYQGVSKNDLANRFMQNPGELIGFALGMLIALLITVFVSSFIAGLIAKKKGFLVGSLVPLLLIIIFVIGSIQRGSYNFSPAGLSFFIFILCFGALFGYLGVKLSARLFR